MDRFGPTGKVSKNISPPFEVDPISRLDRSKWAVPFDHFDSFSIPGRRCLVSWRKTLITALLWIFNSRSIGVARTSMYSYYRSLAASFAKCMFGLLTLKAIYFPREFGMFFTSFDSYVVFEVIWQISGKGLLKITHYTG